MTDILQWQYSEDGAVKLSNTYGQENVVRDRDVIVPLGALSASLGAFSDAVGIARVLSVKDYFGGIDLDTLLKAYPHARFMWISEIKLVSDTDVSSYEVGFHNMDIEAGMKELPAIWTGMKQGRRALISATIIDGGEKVSMNDVPVDHFLWYSGHGRFEHYISSDRDIERSSSWYPEFTATMLDFVDIVEDVEEWQEQYIEMETLYHYRDFTKAFAATDSVPAEVVLEICRVFGISKDDLSRALTAMLDAE